MSSTSASPQVAANINSGFKPTTQWAHADQQVSNINTRMAKRAKHSGNTLHEAVTSVLGGDVNLTPVTSRNLDMMVGTPHSTTGIPYAIAGSANVINVDVSEYLATFQDPIKAILGTSVHQEAKVIVTRKYVVGGRSLITPEHAPARTVAIQEDAREVMMTRYGGDIEMNLNLFLRPQDAKEELDMKIGAQRRELERTLVEHGYSVLMEEGTNIVDALIRSNPSYNLNAGSTNRTIIDAAERINISSVFGAMSKHPFPIANLLAAAKYASAYTTTNSKGSVLLLPHGTPDILRYTRKENMVFDIAGPDLLSRNNGKPISMELENTYVDPNTSVKIVIHRSMPTFDAGVANPDVGHGGLTSTSTFGSFYAHAKGMQIVDFDNRSWKTVLDVTDMKKNACELILKGMLPRGEYDETATMTAYLALAAPCANGHGAATEVLKLVDGQKAGHGLDDTKKVSEFLAVSSFCTALLEGTKFIVARPRMKAVMSSAILAAPGSETGELMIGYPFTSVSTSASEYVKIQLRVYMSAILKRPENVIIMRDVFFEGLESGHGQSFTPAEDNEPADLVFIPVPADQIDESYFDLAEVHQPTATGASAVMQMALRGANVLPHITKDTGTKSAGEFAEFVTENEQPTRLYRGTSRVQNSTQTAWDTTDNCGHLGVLDTPRAVDRLWGSFVYSSLPDAKHH
jgi:hypothetical protein